MFTKFIKKEEELDVINAAYGFALEKHGNKVRRNGDPYISHPLEVANILTDLNVDYVTIACALILGIIVNLILKGSKDE